MVFAVARVIVGDPREGGAAVVTFVNESVRLGMVGSPEFGVLSCEYRNRAMRTSHSVLADAVCVSSPNVIAGTEALRRTVASKAVTDVGASELTQFSLCRLCMSRQPGARFHVSFAKPLFCS